MELEVAAKRLESCLRELYKKGICERRDIILWMDPLTGEVVAVGSALEIYNWEGEHTEYAVYFVDPGTHLDLHQLRFKLSPPRHLGPPTIEGEQATLLFELGENHGEYYLAAGTHHVMRRGVRPVDEDHSVDPDPPEVEDPWGDLADNFEDLPRRAPARRRIA